MPANRSRTARWRECLAQILDRNGALEIAIARDHQQEGMGSQLVWRVRLLDMNDEDLIVEPPMALGQVIRIDAGTELVGIMAVGQNRWMFSTTCQGYRQGGSGRRAGGLRLSKPTQVTRCQRRVQSRVELDSLQLPEVDIWPLLDPKSVLVAERANELEIDRECNGGSGASTDDASMTFENTMPEVGPKFTATLLNLGGGGVGLRVRQEDGQAFARHKVFWLRINLRPELSVPICATGKLIHTHLDSSQAVYGGLAFDFSFNADHQRFVVDQVCRYIDIQQQNQVARKSA